MLKLKVLSTLKKLGNVQKLTFSFVDDDKSVFKEVIL